MMCMKTFVLLPLYLLFLLVSVYLPAYLFVCISTNPSPDVITKCVELQDNTPSSNLQKEKKLSLVSASFGCLYL
jgi:hypothetical protein